jgi:hypothetical protein
VAGEALPIGALEARWLLGVADSAGLAASAVPDVAGATEVLLAGTLVVAVAGERDAASELTTAPVEPAPSAVPAAAAPFSFVQAATPRLRTPKRATSASPVIAGRD